jgi:tetratricopeptide (TPR) repeat protein
MSLTHLAALAGDAQIHPVVYIASLLAGHLWRLLGDPHRAMEMHERALQAAYAANVPSFVLHARAQQVCDQLLAAPDAAGFAGADAIIEQARCADERPIQSLGWLARAGGLLRLGRLDEAMLSAERAVTIARTCPDAPLIGEGLTLLTQIRSAAGHATACDAALAEAQSIAEQSFAPLAIPLNMPGAHELRMMCMAALLRSSAPHVHVDHQAADVAVVRKHRATS